MVLFPGLTGWQNASMIVDSPMSMFWVPHLPALREACGWAAQFELSVRISAEAIFGTDGSGAKDLDDLFARVLRELRLYLSVEQIDALTSVGLCQLRHDLLHARLSKAYGKLGGKTNDPSVASVIKLREGESTLAQLERGIAGAARPLVETKTADAGIVMWVAQAGARGIFPLGAKAFETACIAMHAGLHQRSKAIAKRDAGQAGKGP